MGCMRLCHQTLVALVLLLNHSSGFVIPSKKTAIRLSPSSTSVLFEETRDDDGFIKKNPMQLLWDPKPTKIPKELREEIYAAEANTPLAKDRGIKVAFCYILSFFFFTLAAFNATINEGTKSLIENGDFISYTEAGFGFVETNDVIKALLTGGVAGYLEVLVCAAFFFIGENYQNTQFENAEKIYEELMRRRELREKATRKKKRKESRNQRSSAQKKRKKEKAKNKGFEALTEIISEEITTSQGNTEESQSNDINAQSVKEGEEGMIGKLKGWFKQADSMAASQALLLNKDLEDKGILDKITDESGLRVIGKEAAAKLQEEAAETKNSTKVN